MAETPQHTASAHVLGRLHELGLTPEQLTESIDQGYVAAAMCTENDPVLLASEIRWGKATGSLRDRLRPLGWTISREHLYETTMSPDRKIALVVAAGDAFTGMAGRNPSTRRKKGVATMAAIQANNGFRTLDIADLFPAFPSGQALPDVKTYILLHYFDRDAEEIRVELSLPVGMATDGTVNVWRERIILPPISLENGSVPAAEEPEVEVEPDVEWRD